MSYFLRAWIADDAIVSVNTNMNPITFDVIQIEQACTKIDAEVDGDYQFADHVLPLLTYDPETKTLSGLPILWQEPAP